MFPLHFLLVIQRLMSIVEFYSTCRTRVCVELGPKVPCTYGGRQKLALNIFVRDQVPGIIMLWG